MVHLLRVVKVTGGVCLIVFCVTIVSRSTLSNSTVDNFQSKIENHFRRFESRDVFKQQRTVNNTARKTIPVYVIEEHHEVIPYWFQAGKTGLLPTRGNILIHIDGHPDSVKPKDPSLLYQYPSSDHDISRMMSSNDAFIWAAIAGGLLSRVIWISPSWNVDFPGNIREIFSIGLTFDFSNNEETALCFCRSILDEQHHTKCFTDVHDDRKQIPVSSCHVQTSYLQEDILDSDAAKQGNDWISSQGNIIIDIDEDYYGCEAAIQPLLDVNISLTFIDDHLTPAIGNLFCARDSKSERFFDKVFHDLIAEISQDSEKSRVVQQTVKSINTSKIIEELCDEEELESRVLDVVDAICQLSKTQMMAVADLGICLSSSSKQYSFDRMNGMRLCEGYNRPGSKYVNFYTPTEEEINERTKELKEILSKFPTPGLVTVCRSSRDGYVPAKYREKIEGDIIETLSAVFTDINNESLVYDEELHGGKDGWYNRHQRY